MPSIFFTSGKSGKTLIGTIQKIDATGALGDHWNASSESFSASVSFANRSIALTEGSGDDLGSYSGGEDVALGSYTGWVIKRIHDSDQSNLVVGAAESYIVSGVEDPSSTKTDISALPLATYTEIETTQGGLTSTNMRGTDLAMLAASYTAPDNANIAVAAADATAAKAAAESTNSRLTAARAGYLDNLSAGAVALEASLQSSLTAATIDLAGPSEFQIPSSGTNTYQFELHIYDGAGNMEVPDSTPTFAAANESGTDRSSNLGSVTNPSTGVYRVTYMVASTHAVESIRVLASAIEGSSTITAAAVVPATATVASGGFNTSDRTNLTAIFDKLPSKAYLAGTAAADGDIDLDEVDGAKTAFMADVSTIGTEVTAIKAKTDNLPASPAAVSDIPTASAVATQVDTTLTASHGSGDWNGDSDATLANQTTIITAIAALPTASAISTQVDTDLTTAHGAGAWNEKSDATLANQTSILATIGGIVPDPVSANEVSCKRTWRVKDGNEDDRATQVITLTSGVDVTLAMDFSRALNPGTSISSVSAVTDISGNGLVPTNDLPSQDRKSAHFDVTGLTANTRYELRATVVTTDGQTLIGRGVLQCD